MMSWNGARVALAGAVAATALAACTLRQAQGDTALPGVEGLTAMRGLSSSQDILFVSEYGGGVLDVFTWPQAKYVTSYQGFNSTPLMGLCVDKKGDVWVVEGGGHPGAQELSHAGGVIGEVNDKGEEPYGCAVDPKSGDLAIASEEGVYDQTGSVAVWKKGAGSPVTYTDPSIELALWCGYDDKGDLFVDGLPSDLSSEFVLAELPKGGKSLVDIKLKGIVFPGAIQWAGGTLTIGDPSYKIASAVDRVQISGTTGKITGRTVLRESYEVFEDWIAGDMVIGPDDGPSLSTVQLWKYPAGGKPTATLSKGTGFFNGPIGAVVSVAK